MPANPLDYKAFQPTRMLLYAVIFLSGGAILALELLASRIMTPYFGVSLYIWTGILSITLISLAAGYWGGGRWAAGRTPERLLQWYLLAPAAAALAIVAACLIYPWLFAALGAWSLVMGAFAACLVFLFVPLVLTSAMNPLLVAIELARLQDKSGDAGSGRVFFVSTLGSVAGVLVTAFALIPYVSNYVSVLVVAVVLAALSAIGAYANPRMHGRTGVLALSLMATLAAALLAWQADAYTGRRGPVSYNGEKWRVEATAQSLFGTIKILRSESAPGTTSFTRIYFQDGLTQNSVDERGRSLSYYTYALEALALSHRPGARRALVLGLGAGMVPTRLAAHGMSVEAVDIDPASLQVAQTYFGYDTTRVKTHIVDARAFLHACPQRYDIVVVDLFHGDGTPDYLVTREFFGDLRKCLADGGVAVFNTFADLDRPESYAHLLVTLKAELPHLALYRPDWPNANHINSFIVAAAAPMREPVRVTLDDVPSRHANTLWDMLARPIPVDERVLRGGRLVTDALNAATHDLATSNMVYRRDVVENVPREFLLN